MTGLTYKYILEHDNREPHCSKAPRDERMRHIEWITCASEYAEPGYSNPDGLILFGNWNEFSRDAGDLLERAGYELEWEDEWTLCGDCGKAIRTSPDCYQWTPYYHIFNDCEVVCLDCIDWKGYLESIENNPRSCCLPQCNPEEYGYRQYNGTYENGLHMGMNDNPNKILKELQDKGFKHIIFRLAASSQFYIEFEVYHK